VIPQFTLFADTSKGRRPEFFGAMRPPRASQMFDEFAQLLLKAGVGQVEKGLFGAHMEVQSVNDGPVSLEFEV
jgi:D-tyrosyl-tRNA(Tyr) deacylase